MATKNFKAGETKSAIDGIKTAFAPVTDAIQNLQGKIEVPQAARDFVAKAADSAQERADAVNAGVTNATGKVESAAVAAVGEFANVSRNIQKAVHEDVTAYFAHLGKLSSAGCPSEALQIQADYLRGRGEAIVARAKASSDYVSTLVQNGVKSVQENVSSLSKTAA